MVEIFVKNKEIVYPGQVLAKGINIFPLKGVYRENEEIISKFYGIVEIKDNTIRVIPLNKQYLPEEGDLVIGEIKEVMPTSWLVDINSPFSAVLFLRDAVSERLNPDEVDLSKIYDVGDVILAKVIRVTRNKTVRVSVKDSPIKKLKGGLITFVSPAKVAKILGKKGKNVNELKEKTNTEIIVGQNGVVWIKGESRKDELFVAKIIQEIENSLDFPNLDYLIEKVKKQ